MSRASYLGHLSPFVVPMQSMEIRRLQQQWSRESGLDFGSPQSTKYAYSRIDAPQQPKGMRSSSSMPRLGGAVTGQPTKFIETDGKLPMLTPVGKGHS